MNLRRRLKCVARRIGRRGSALLFLSLLDILYAYALWAAPLAQRALDLLLPYPAWAVIWLIVGLVCLVQAPMKSDRFAFALAVALKVAWGAVLGTVWLMHPAMDPRGWIGTVIYWGLAFLIGVIASWPEYVKRDDS